MTENIDELVFAAVFSKNDTEKKEERVKIRNIAQEKGIVPSSTNNLYRAIGRGVLNQSRHGSGFTVPAINIRTMTYETARVIFQLMLKHKIGALIFEIARSEIEYTDQRPDEYATSVLAAAIKEGYQGPVFIQGDHFQFSKNKFNEDPAAETGRIKDLIEEAVEAGFYNIDIDASTLVDLSKKDLDWQQQANYETTADLTNYIRTLQPNGVTVSIGGEIDHIGGKNSTVVSFEAFMKGYLPLVKEEGLPAGRQGISKISVQTGTTHGGVPLLDGTIADVALDFSVLRDIGKVAHEKYGLGGAVQHGASTLPSELFNKFPENGTLEIHLATAFQNIVYDNLPKVLRDEMYTWIKEHLKSEWEEKWSKEQFVYRTRKKAFAPFKENLWRLSDEEKKPVLDALAREFELLTGKLNVSYTKEIVNKYINTSP